MIQINPLKSYIDGGVRAAITTPPSASLVFDLPGKAIWVKGVKLKGTDHTYTFSHDNYITLTNTSNSNESEDIKIGVNTSALKNAIDTTYGVVSTTTNGLAPKFTSENKLAASTATTYYFLGWTGSTLKWYQAPFRNVRINSETTDRLGINNTDPLIISSGNGISVTWDSTNKKIIITNTKPDVNHNTHYTTMLYIGENNDTKANKNVANPYLKLFDDSIRRATFQIKAGSGIAVTSDTNGNITITNSSPDVNHNTDRTGIKLTTVSGTKKTDSTLILANSTSGLNIQGGTNKFLIGDGTNYIEVPVTPSFTISNKDATIGTALTTIATIAGVDIKAKIASYSLSNHTHLVKINGSTKTIAASGAVDLGNYLPLSGGTMGGTAWIVWPDSGNISNNNEGVTFPVIRGGLEWRGQTDYIKLFSEETGRDNLNLVLQFGDDNSNGLSIRNKSNTQTSYISSSGVITTGTFKGNLDWSYITNKPSSYIPSAHTHAWNSLTHSSTTENQAILTNGSANGWKLYTLNISGWNNAANNAHSHSNKSVLDGITSTLVSNWNTAYNFVNTITGTDTDKVINKWDEIVNFLAGITEDNKLNTLLNSKLSVYELADNTNVGAIKNNGIYYSTSDSSSGTLLNSPFSNSFTLINMISYDGGDDLRRSRLAFNAYGEVKVSNDRGLANTAETWYNVLTSNNSGISGSTIKLNGTSITVYSSSTADSRFVKKTGDTMSGVLTIDTTGFGALTIKRNDDTNGASIQFRGKSSVYGYIGLNNSTKDKQFLRWNSDTSKTYTILDTSSTYTSNGKGVINGTTITQVDNATNAINSTNSTNSTNARKLVNWYSTRPTSLNTQFGDGSLRIFYATSSTTEGKSPDDATILHLSWDNNGGWDTQLGINSPSGRVYSRAQNSGTWQPWKTLAFTTDIPSSLKNPYSLNVFGVTYDGSAAKVVSPSNFISLVTEGTSTVTDGTMFITSYASNSGFADTNAVNVPYKRKAILLWEYIKVKTDSLYATKSHNHDDRYVRAFGTSNDNIDSDWGQSFKTFDPIPSGTPPELNPNISILNIGNNFNRRKLLAFIYNNDNIYYRRHVDSGFTNWRRIAFANEIPTSLKNPHALTISLNGTSLGPYDGSAAKSINITPGSIGAATSGHNHDSYYVKYGKVVKSTTDNANVTPYLYNVENEEVISGYYKYWYIFNMGQYSGGNFGTLIAMPYQDSLADSELFIRSANNGSWRTWRRVLHSNNYASILDSRYYTKSEVNNLLSNKLNISNFNWTNLPDKIVAGNEFNIVNAGFNNKMWFNYLPINDRSKTATITGYHFGNGATGYTSIKASGFIKNGSSSSYVLLGDGGHKLESSLNVASASVASKVYGQVGDTGSHELVRCDMNNDQFRIIAGSSGNNNGWAEIATADDGNEPIYVRQYTGVFSSVKRTLTLLDANGYTHFPSYINIGGNENNNSSPDRVWGSNSSDSYLRSYRTSALRVSYANSADTATTSSMLKTSAWKGGSYATSDTHYLCLGYMNCTNSYDALTLLISSAFWGNQHGSQDIITIQQDTNTNGTRTIQTTVGRLRLGGSYERTFYYYKDNTNFRLYIYVYVTGGNSYGRWNISYLGGNTTWVNVWQTNVTKDASWISIEYSAQVNYANSAGSATKLQTARKIWGQSFDGTRDISDSLSGVGHIQFSADNSYSIGTTTSEAAHTYTRQVWTRHLNASRVYTGDTNLYIGYNNTAQVKFYSGTKQSGDGSNERMTISTNGNVGIGTTSPAYKLHVAGDIYTTTGFKKNGSSDSYVLLGGGGHQTISSLSVNYASSAGNADKVDGYHASSLWRSDGATWNPSTNVSLNASANNQEWSFDIKRNGYTGCYWHVWDSALGTILRVNADNGKVYAPYNFVGNLEGNASTSTKLLTTRTIWGQSFNGTTNIDNTLRIRQTTGNYCEGIRIQTGDGAWATIILGATADSGTNTNAWSIHRKSDNNFAISRNSSDGTNGLVMTSVGMGLGTTAPTQRLDVHGNIRATGLIIREGSSLIWVNGRRGALLRETTSTGYHTLWSLKTTNGSWDFGEYNSSGWNNIPVLSYITDTNFNSGNNTTTTYQIKFPLDSGTIALTKNIPTSLKSPYSLTLKANGTTLAIYDGSSAKEANFTYANVGAASASHSHTYIVAEDLRSKYPGQILDPQRMKLSFLSASTLGIKNDGSYYDVITVRSYIDSSGGSDNALLFSKNSNSLYHTRFAFGSTSSWGSPLLIIDSGNIGSQSVAYASKAGSVAWDSITGKPSSFTPSSHTHSWTSITDKIVAGNEFNIVNAGFNNKMWFNYLPINDRSKTATITGYHFGNGATGYTSIKASGFIKNGSSSSYVLLGDGGHKTISSLSVNYANSAGNADTVDRYHANTIYNAPSFTVNNSNTSNTYILLATITISGTSLGCAEFTTLFQNRECLDSSSFILSGAIRRSSTTNVTATLSYITLHTKTPRNIYLRSDDGVTFMVYILSATSTWTTYYRAIPIVDSGNITYSNTGTTSPISGSVLNITATKGGNVNYASSAGNADTLDSYHANGLLTALSNSNNGVSITVGGTTKSISNISVNYANSAGNADKVDGQHFNWNNNKNDHTYLWAASDNGNAYLVHRASISVNYATYARYVYCTSGNYLNFQWSGLNGQPTWLWGSNDGANCYVWNPSNFSVYKANKSDQLEAYTSWGFTDPGRFVRAIRYNGWHTRLYMGYYRDATLENTVHVGYADDADTLDGNHASAFALVGHTHNYDNVYSKLGHTHDDRYYTESEINSKLSAYLPLAGGTMTGLIKGNNKGGSWILGRANAALYLPRNVQGDWHPVVGFKTKTGSWEFGSVGYDDNASFSWESDSNYNSGTNTTTVVYLRNTSGTIALTSEIPTVTNYYWANMKVSSTSSTSTSPTFSTCYTSNWFRSTGLTGWYNETYEGGWYMTDTTWVRTYNSKGIYTNTGTIYNLGHVWLACNNGYNVGIGTTSPSYKLHVSGDSYATGWSRAASGFYCQDTGVHFTHNGTKGQIAITSNNEFCWGANSNILYFNYAASSYGTTVTLYIWNAGSSSSYASHTMGHITLGNGNYLLKRVGSASSWYNGRDKAIVRQTSNAGDYCVMMSSKTTSGSWEIGNEYDDLCFTHITDSNYNSRNNNYLGQIVFTSDGEVYAAHFYENSDIRYKKILKNLSINSNTIANLPLFDFEWIENNTIGTGTSALAVLQILPNLVSGTDKLTLDYGVLGTIAGITACKELVTLKSEIKQLKEKVKLLEDKLRKYENI